MPKKHVQAHCDSPHMNAEKKRSKQVMNVEKARSPRIWVPERRKRTFTSENERGKNAFSHYCKKRAKVQISYSKKRQSQIFEGRYLREARAPRAGTVRPDFGKMIHETMRASATTVRDRKAHFPRLKANVKSCSQKKCQKTLKFSYAAPFAPTRVRTR